MTLHLPTNKAKCLTIDMNFNCQQVKVLMIPRGKLTDILDMYIVNLHLAMPQKCCCPFLPSNTVLHYHFPKKRALFNNS